MMISATLGAPILMVWSPHFGAFDFDIALTYRSSPARDAGAYRRRLMGLIGQEALISRSYIK